MTFDGVSLACGGLEVRLAPETGGSIARFDWLGAGGRRPILRGPDELGAPVLAMGSFPLVPFVNRVRNGRFAFRGREVRLAANMAGDPSPLHGQGWLSAWQVESAGPAEAVLRFEHEPGEWPWAYEAIQTFALDENGLDVTLICRNLSAEAMPCGLGQHPYFHCGPATRIDTEVSHAWTIDELVLPVNKVPAEGVFDLADRSVCGQGLDHGFGGWSGRALLTDPDWPFQIELTSSSASFFQLYSPVAGGIFVAEPVSHANAALNEPEEEWNDLGLRVIEPGEAMELGMRLEVRPK